MNSTLNMTAGVIFLFIAVTMFVVDKLTHNFTKDMSDDIDMSGEFMAFISILILTGLIHILYGILT